MRCTRSVPRCGTRRAVPVIPGVPVHLLYAGFQVSAGSGAALGRECRAGLGARRAGRCSSSGLCRGMKGRALAVPCIMQTAPSPYADVSFSSEEGINSSRAYKEQRLDVKLLDKICINLGKRNKDLVKRATCGSSPLNILFLMFLFTV